MQVLYFQALAFLFLGFCTKGIPQIVRVLPGIKSLLQRNIQSNQNTPDALPPDYVADFSVLLRSKMVQVLYGILIKAHISYSSK